MQTPSPHADRPVAVTLIALFQGFLGIYLLYFTIFACLNPVANLSALRFALRILIGRTDAYSYARNSHEEIMIDLFGMVVFAIGIAAYGVVTGLGLWRLQKWARHSVAGEYGTTVVLWARSFLFFGVGGGFSRVPETVYSPFTSSSLSKQ